MHIRTIIAGPVETNAFVVSDDTSNQALVVDAPPDSAAQILDAVRDSGLTVSLIVLTHSHFDHVVDAAALKRDTGAPIAIHPEALAHLEAGIASGQVPYQVKDLGELQHLAEGDELAVGSLRFQVILTPGHAPGQVSLYETSEAVVFGGDTLFPGGYGRVDLPGSSAEETRESMRKLLELPDDVTVYPGHGLPARIGDERNWMETVAERGVS